MGVPADRVVKMVELPQADCILTRMMYTNFTRATGEMALDWLGFANVWGAEKWHPDFDIDAVDRPLYCRYTKH